MYNAWWIAIGFGILMVIFAVINIPLYIKQRRIAEQYYEARERAYGATWNDPKYKEKWRQYHNLQDKYDKDIPYYFWICFAICALIVFITIMVASALTIKTKQEYNQFIETQTMVEEVYNGDYTQYENLGLNNKIIELNQWLVNAKTSKKQWGNWSYYCVVDVESLNYITLLDAQNGE